MDRRKKGTGYITLSKSDEHAKSPWRVVFYVNGKAKNKYFKTEKDAKAFLRDINANIKKQQALLTSGLTFDGLTEAFLDYKKKSNIKLSSYETLEGNIIRTSKYIGNVPLSKIDSEIVQDMVNQIAAADLSKSTMQKSVCAVTAMLKYAASKNYITNLPVIQINYPTNIKKEIAADNNWFTEQERARYEEECRKTFIPKKYCKYAGQSLFVHDSGYRLLLLLHTGLRIGEALALTWDDYDETSKTLNVSKNLVFTKNGKVIHTPKTTSGKRLIVLTRPAVEDLHELRSIFEVQTKKIKERKKEELLNATNLYQGETLKEELYKIESKYKEILQNHKYICGGVTFPFGLGAQSGLEQTHRKICKTIKLQHNVTIHGLRHTFVTHYYIKHKNDPDFDLALFSRSIGHSNIRTTMEIYAHLQIVETKSTQRSIEDLKDI